MAGNMETQGSINRKSSMHALGVKAAPGCLQYIAAYLMLLANPTALGQKYISPNVPVVRRNLAPIACLSGVCRDQEDLAMSSTVSPVVCLW